MYEILAESILLSIIENKRKSSSKNIRIWSAGCACGEEAYSLAILLNKAIEKAENDFSFLIFATDIDTQALKKAKSALYPRESFESTKVGVLDKYFISKSGSYKVCPFIKRLGIAEFIDNEMQLKTVDGKHKIFQKV